MIHFDQCISMPSKELHKWKIHLMKMTHSLQNIRKIKELLIRKYQNAKMIHSLQNIMAIKRIRRK